MNAFQSYQKGLVSFVLVLVLVFTTACSAVSPSKPQAQIPSSITALSRYQQLARGNSAKEQSFGDWVVDASKGLIKDAFVRDNNKLGVVISPQVRPNEVKDLAKSLAQGFHKNFPNQDLTVLMYAPDKKLILTTLYDAQSNRVEFQGNG
ncbi:hypothetical protein [Altericista sp. CCNU0014]|uniref:hypothetical protein n=1 Tax=Altericista sp. CCNU0014 TaxID=3082949 RepID=UPI00384DCC7E